MRLGDTHGRIVSLDQLRLGVEEQLLIFSSCLSPGRVKKLQKFINFCLYVGHSGNLKHSKSTWRQSSRDSYQMYKISISWNGNDLRQFSFWYRALSCGADWFTEDVYIWVTTQCPQWLVPYATRNPQVKNERRTGFRSMVEWLFTEFFLPLFSQFSKTLSKMLSVWEPAFFMLDSFKICGANTRMDHFSKSFEQNAPFLSGHI